jgi:hypothetical protein
MLSNFDLEDMAQKHHLNNFVGVFSKDVLPNNLIIGSYIINLENDRDDNGLLNNGSHWLGLFVDNQNTCCFFDSFGFAPAIEIVTFMRKSKKKIYFNEKQVQNINSSSCGLYAFSFCLYMSNNANSGKSTEDVFEDFIDLFSENDSKNEKILKDLYSKF